ncbi:MAG: DEAD/DEAH box helicase [Alphaproteobacteria bacterium]
MTEETTLERFGKAEKKFFDNLKSFAAGGYRFSDEYSLYKQSQQEGFQGYVEGLGQGHKHGYIELPTGVGKTALFISLIKNYLEAANGDENAPRVLIAVPTEKLAVQTAQSFAKFMPEIAKTIETDGDEGKEIDWENSDIGLQYGKKKHAHKKPKVLITTYQSLARDTADKTYPPSEYGYVIYDEGHVITAPTFGKAVEKFKDSIQLAVSATPEYTETKTVGSRLPHRYYQLPLAEAINRGDLCNVRPAILKTGYRIDEALFQKFMEQQGAKPLGEAQLQQLLNQEARNEAVIETYFRGADPASGERYFGQNGMIFCTGVKHADSIAEQFKKTMEKPGDGQALKRWLDNEQIELIAPVHGQTKGAWLKKDLLPNKSDDKRQFQGTKEWYTEDEIFDLHERGKILLLASVAKLKVGFDSPRDSVLFDLADRFSKVDATQIDGRAFRIDPDNPEKTATVFNLMDENTEELYAKYPKMIPIYCAEVIEGADFRPPARRPHAHVRFKEPPPGLEKSLQDSGFEVITDIDEVRTISRNKKEKREIARKKTPEKESDWLSMQEIESCYAGDYRTFKPLLESFAEAKRNELMNSQNLTIEDASSEVERNWIGIRAYGSHKSICGSPQVFIELEKAGKIRPRTEMAAVREDSWLSNKTLASSYVGGGPAIKSILENYAEEKRAELVSHGDSEQLAAVKVDKEYVGMRTKDGKEALCASPQVVKELEQLGKLRRQSEKAAKKDSEWRSIKDLVKLYVGGNDDIKSLLESYAADKKNDLIAHCKSFEAVATELDQQFIGMRVSGKREGICISPRAIQELEESNKLRLRSKQTSAKEDGWLSNNEMATVYIGGAERM